MKRESILNPAHEKPLPDAEQLWKRVEQMKVNGVKNNQLLSKFINALRNQIRGVKEVNQQKLKQGTAVLDVMLAGDTKSMAAETIRTAARSRAGEGGAVTQPSGPFVPFFSPARGLCRPDVSWRRGGRQSG